MTPPSRGVRSTATSEPDFISAARAGLAMFDTAPTRLEVLSEDEMRFRVAWPCVAYAMAQARAALALLDLKMLFPAEANIRVAFEHAMTAQWILLTTGSEGPIEREARRQLDAYSRDMSGFIELPPELLPGDPVDSSGPARSFQHLCARFSPGGERQLYVLYRDLSAAVHVSTRTWLQYLRWGKSGVVGIQPDGDPELGASADIALALAVFLSLGALEELRRDQPRLLEVKALSKQHRVPYSLREDDQEPHLQPRR